jgi:hypothetical protein
MPNAPRQTEHGWTLWWAGCYFLGEANKHCRQPELEVRGSPGLESVARDWHIVSG